MARLILSAERAHALPQPQDGYIGVFLDLEPGHSVEWWLPVNGHPILCWHYDGDETHQHIEPTTLSQYEHYLRAAGGDR